MHMHTGDRQTEKEGEKERGGEKEGCRRQHLSGCVCETETQRDRERLRETEKD